MNTFAIDFETYYDKECSIKTLGTIGYFNHPLFDAYMVSVVGDEGTSFVGDPREFDWSLIEGNRAVSHNAPFDQTLYLYGVEKEWWPSVKYAEWLCTADLAAYCGLPRALKNASAELFDLDVSKETRDNMLGKQWENMTKDFKKEVSEYALKDSELCLKIWQELESQWPETERNISCLNRTISQRGIPIDTSELKTQTENINKNLFEAENSIPWIGEAPTLSRKAFNNECRKMGLEPPVSLAMTDKDANAWIKKHGQKYKWIGAVRDYRRINSLKRKIESFSYATMADQRYYGNIMYWGASTGRFSGGGGNLNLQNLPRGEMFGVDLRKLISSKPNKKLIAVDLSQIEVRTLCWLAGDEDTLKEIQACDDIYEAFAIRFGEWDSSKGVLKDENPKLRHLVKTIVLGCGYGASANKFSLIAGIPLVEAEKAVGMYRTKMNKVVGLWNDLQRRLHVSYSSLKDFKVPLPSGRSINYGKIKVALLNERRNYVAMVAKGPKKIPVRLWGGLLAENASQALARDIFSDMLLRIEEEGIKTIFHVHDEVVVEEDADKADQTLERIIEIMSTPPKWIDDIPLEAEGKVITRYEK
jgi:DNA polymerase I-like protein with 3'-5' exonuclease and polymerase domains